MNKQMIRIKLESFDPRVLDQATKNFVSIMKGIGAPISGPIPLPRKEKKFTVTKSPHVYKESSEHFHLCKYRRLIDIYPNSPKVVEVLSKIDLQSGVNISVKI